MSGGPITRRRLLICGSALFIPGPHCFNRALAATPPTASWLEDFSEGMDHWWIEGGEKVWVEDSRLIMWADGAEKTGASVATAWCRRALPDDFELRFRAQVTSSTIEANNINLFFCYSDPAGKSLEASKADRKTADYGFYHKLNGYIITFLNEKGQARIRIRRNPGFELLLEKREGECRSGVTYGLKVLKQGGDISFFVGGREVAKVTDPNPWKGGLLGLRTFRTRLWWDDVYVSGLRRDKQKSNSVK